MTQAEFDNLLAVEGASGDIYILAKNQHLLTTAKLLAERQYAGACGQSAPVAITDWVDSTDLIKANYPDIDELDGCNLLKDLDTYGYVISID